MFKNCARCYSFYRNDGIVIINGIWSNKEIDLWLKTFQLYVNNLFNYDQLQFTAEIWSPSFKNKENEKLNKKVSIINKKKFFFLDTEIYWNTFGKLGFYVHITLTLTPSYVYEFNPLILRTSSAVIITNLNLIVNISMMENAGIRWLSTKLPALSPQNFTSTIHNIN